MTVTQRVDMLANGSLASTKANLSKAPAEHRGALEDMTDQVLQALVVLTVPLPEGAIKPLQTWDSRRVVRVGPLGQVLPALADLRYTYHLWVARAPVGDEVESLASFFTFGHCGFGGYTVRRRLPRVGPNVSFAVGIASVEERMRRDNPHIEGWFIECNPQEEKRLALFFYRYGFREVEDRAALPDKIFKDCQNCPRLYRCDEVAMARGQLPRVSILGPRLQAEQLVRISS